MFIRDCWMTILEIKDRISNFKAETVGKESYTETEPAWPFPKFPPSTSGEDRDED